MELIIPKEQIKAEWVKALRSGKYKQGRLKLKTDDGSYCAFGVLAEICYGTDISKIRNYILDDSPGLYHFPELHFANKNQTKIIVMNDYERKSFSEIADYIEANL